MANGPKKSLLALAGFGLALGLPFALFALFPSWLQSLPRSGSWMNTVKIVFGFLELASIVQQVGEIIQRGKCVDVLRTERSLADFAFICQSGAGGFDGHAASSAAHAQTIFFMAA